MKISVIIPHYNSWDYLENLIDTVPVDGDIEILVIDDHSECVKVGAEVVQMPFENKDNETFCCPQSLKEKLESHHANILLNTEGKGPGPARNVGLNHAAGEYILFADADDYFLPEAFDIIKATVSAASKQTDIIYFPPTSKIVEAGIDGTRHQAYADLVENYIRECVQRNECLLENTSGKKAYAQELHLRYDFNVLWSKIYRRTIFQEKAEKFDETPLRFEDLLIGEDVWFCTKAAYYAEAVEAVNEPIYCVTENQDSLTSKPHPEVFEKQVDVAIRRGQFLKEKLSKEEYELLHVNGKGSVFAAKTIGGIELAFRTWRRLGKAGIRTFYINDFVEDVKKAAGWKKTIKKI